MGSCTRAISKNKVLSEKTRRAEQIEADERDPNQFAFLPGTDLLLEDRDTWLFSKHVDLSHFKLVKRIGVGTHSVVWLVEQRYHASLKLKFI